MAGLAFAQTNLVANGDFETIQSTGIDCDFFSTSGTPCANKQEWFEDYWEQSAPWTCPAKESSPGCSRCVASADHNCDGATNENVFGFMLNKEYICAPLAAPLVAGHQYYIEFDVRAAYPLVDAGIRFGNSRPKQCGYEGLSNDGQPHFEIDNTIQFDLNMWHKVSGYFTADQNYSWIIFGTFDQPEQLTQTFRVDNVKIYEWAPADCPPLLLLENRQYPVITGAVQKAEDQLYAGFNVGASTADGNVIIPVDASISYKAGRQVALMDGFGALYGSEFRAYIAPCGSDCVAPDAFAGISQTICSDQPIQLGADPVGGYGYTWVASPASATQYLSSVSVADPVFTPPPGEGDVTFYVTVVNTCGQSSTGAVTLHYDDTPSAVAQFTVNNLVLGDEPAFDLLLNSDIEKVQIEILDASLNTAYYTEVFWNPVDFQCCHLPWVLPAPLSPCNDYRIRITVTNFCTGATAVQIIDWNRNRTFALTAGIPNVITPNDDGINDRFCVSFTGASQISIEVKASSGVTVFYDMITNAYPPTACIWDGECNQGLPACVEGPLEDGTYYYIVKFFACDGTTKDYAGFVTLLNGVFRMQQLPGDTTAGASAPQTNVFPNPSTGEVTIVPGTSANANTNVEIYNALGEKIASRVMNEGEYFIAFDLSFAPAGVYYAHYFANGEMHAVRFVIDRRE